MIKAVVRKIQYSIRDLLVNRKNRSRLHNTSFSIVSNDCLGGVIARDLKVRMNSPTRNFYFNASDFIKFCKRLDYYLSLEPEQYTGSYCGIGDSFLKASLGDLVLFLVHYDSVNQAKEEWRRRRVRINKENLFIMMNDRNLCTEEDIREFDQLPFENKICFTHIPYPQYSSTFYIHGSENDKYLKPLTDYVPKLGFKRYYDQFDYVSWLNKRTK